MSLDPPKTDSELLALLEQRSTPRPYTVVRRVDTTPTPFALGPSSPLRTARRRTAPKRTKVSEHEIQAAFFKWVESAIPAHPELATFYAVPNGGHRHISVAVKLKAEGVKAGVLDTHLPIARGGYHSLYIEFKKPGGVTSPAQMDWFASLALYGNRAALCTSAEAAIQTTLDYLALTGTDQ